MSRKILVLFAHPALQRSRVHKALVAAVHDLEGVTFNDLYELYPDFLVDVDREQTLLREHDLVVLQYPFYWYSTPALLKEWMDLVLEHGFAYGRHGTALVGKSLMSAISAGGREIAYREDGLNHYTIAELLRPVEQTARLCGMTWLPPFVVYGTHLLDDPATAREAEDYRRVLIALRDEVVDPAALNGLDRINTDLDLIGA